MIGFLIGIIVDLAVAALGGVGRRITARRNRRRAGRLARREVAIPVHPHWQSDRDIQKRLETLVEPPNPGHGVADPGPNPFIR